MFTGIIETTGQIKQVTQSGDNHSFLIESPISPELKVDQSVSHNGVCLTVEEVIDNQHRVTAIRETLSKTNLGAWQAGDLVNLERCLAFNGRLDGHLVQGHVDATAVCIAKKEMNGSWQYTFEFPAEFGAYIIEKGSISLNGISLTVFNVTGHQFEVAIIPYTYHHTNIWLVEPGDKVNVEFDMIGKYVKRMMEQRS
ncbi:MAG TPA: riboflavin synthase [Chitinophagaceae bacterium]|nr:riboflavin synthase [Chitinophagaceae bacterium]